MTEKYKSIFAKEIEVHILARRAELSSESFRHYKRTTLLFDDYLNRINHKDKNINEDIVDNWIKEVGNGISLNTLGIHINNIRQLLLYLIACGYSCFIPSTLKARDSYVPYLYFDEDIKNIFLTVDSFISEHAVKNIYVEKEPPLILRLLYRCGLRIGETVNIKVGDVDFDRNVILLRVTKKYKQRLVPLGEDLAKIIYLYCVSMDILNCSESYLFPQKEKNHHISTGNVSNYFRIIRKKAGIKNSELKTNGRGACLHCFRHTFAVRSFDKNERNGIRSYESVPFLSTY